MTPDRPNPLQHLEPGVRRLLAPNPSPMTHWGTNTYIVGEGRVAVIDPGPSDPGHLAAILDALDPGETVSHILVTHSHLDHSPLSAPLSAATGAPVLAFGDSMAGRTAVMNDLAREGLAGGGEGVDPSFAPNEIIPDGSDIHGADWTLSAIWTPGHFGNHLSFAMGNVVFTGDHIMEWSTSLVSPPDGDLTAFMASTEKLIARSDRVYYPGHGDPVHAPADRAKWLLNHRKAREASILDALLDGPASIPALTARIYTDIPTAMLPVAQRNVFAHLIDLVHHSRVSAHPKLSFTANFSLA